VLILTMSDSRDDLGKALRLGARGYLLKDMEPDEVADSIRRAARGELAIAPAMALKLAGLLDEEQQPAQRSVLDRLTSRERQILDYVAQGMSNKAIARVLGISHDTVKLHVRHILSKLSLGSRVAAAVFAVEHRAAAGEETHERSRLRPLPSVATATPALVPSSVTAVAAPADAAATSATAVRTTPAARAAGRLRQR
jgi:two-component system nitrate/nitrite response regulator NarL